MLKQKGYILLVDRGGCSFVEKVRNAQKDNATAVLIADNTCLCSFQESCTDTDDQECEESEPTMDDDGTAGDIRIPSMMLLKPDGDRLRNELMQGTNVDLKLSWPIPKAINGVSRYELWLTPDDLVSHQFLMSFQEAAKALGNKAVFTPKMFVTDGTTRGCRHYDEADDPCPGFCTNYGRYCEPRSYYDFDTYDNKGTKMIVESLRRACIWQVYGQGDGIGTEWWAYVQQWIMKCGSSHYSSSCAENLYGDVRIDKSLVEQCMEDSGNFRNDVSNDMLDNYLDEAADYDVSFAPTMFVNGVVVRGALTFGTILETLCMTYEENDSMPDICYQWNSCSSQQQCKTGACILQGGQCGVYQVPSFSGQEVVYDDDYIESDGTIAETEQDDDYSQQTDRTEKPVVQPETSDQTEDSVLPPTNPSKPMPTNPSGSTPTNPPGSLPGQLYEDERIVENIQIYENGNSNAGFAAGLGAGIGGAVFAFVIFLIVEGRGRRRRRRRADLQPLVPSPSFAESELTMDARSNYHSEHFRDEDYSYSQDSYDEPRKHSRKKYKSRRSIKRARALARQLHDDEPTPLRRQRYEDEESQYTRDTRSNRGEKYAEEASVLSMHGFKDPRVRYDDDNDEDDDEEEVSIRLNEDGSRGSTNPFDDDGTIQTDRSRRSRRGGKYEEGEIM